jgi:hypothetical protein
LKILCILAPDVLGGSGVVPMYRANEILYLFVDRERAFLPLHQGCDSFSHDFGAGGLLSAGDVRDSPFHLVVET